MSSTDSRLPQLGEGLFLTDGGIETTLIFHRGLDLPDFAAFDLLERAGGEGELEAYFRSYADLARKHGTGLVLESATWRANPDWGARLGYGAERLERANLRAVALLERLRSEYAPTTGPIVVSGCVGPRGDGYVPANAMSAAEAEDYHAAQIATFGRAGVDLVTAITMNYTAEAIGVARAARRVELPVAISFTVETDGQLPTGQPLAEAIDEVDRATEGHTAYYMVNCAHPTHFASRLDSGAAWARRIRGLRANASCRSHAELNEAPDLDIGDIDQLARQHAALVTHFPWLSVLGGCCGTDTRHVDAIATSCAALYRRRAVAG